MPRQADGLCPAETRTARVCRGGPRARLRPPPRGGHVAYECLRPSQRGRATTRYWSVSRASGGAHAAGRPPGRSKPGWWDVHHRPRESVRHRPLLVLSSNVLGSCYGTTGPSRLIRRRGRPYGSRFPVITIGDMVKVQRPSSTASASAAFAPSRADSMAGCRRCSGRSSTLTPSVGRRPSPRHRATRRSRSRSTRSRVGP